MIWIQQEGPLGLSEVEYTETYIDYRQNIYTNPRLSMLGLKQFWKKNRR